MSRQLGRWLLGLALCLAGPAGLSVAAISMPDRGTGGALACGCSTGLAGGASSGMDIARKSSISASGETELVSSNRAMAKKSRNVNPNPSTAPSTPSPTRSDPACILVMDIASLI